MSEVDIEVTLKIKTDKIHVELTKDEAKQLRDALDKALKAESVFSGNEIKKLIEDSFRPAIGLPINPNPFNPHPLNPLQPYEPYKPYWEWNPHRNPQYGLLDMNITKQIC